MDPEAGVRGTDSIFFAAVEMTRMPMVLCGPADDEPVLYANQAFLDLVQRPREQVLGRNMRMLQGPRTDRRVLAQIREALHARHAVGVELLNYKADGTPFWNALFIAPVFDADGRLLHWFASLLDVTERRASEQSIQQAQKMEAIGRLASGVAHDFNNLLHVIVSSLALARRLTAEDAALSRLLQRSEQAAVKAGRLTDQLLSFARHQRLSAETVQLNELVPGFADILAAAAGDQVVLAFDLEPGLPPCSADRVHLEMALLNLVINAGEAMAGSGGRVTVSTARQSAPDGTPQVVLRVSDDGPGIAPALIDRVTEPFFTTKASGTGLGLAMVYGFMQQSGGQLAIHSDAGQGTTVSLSFDAAAPAPAAG